jgi:methionyl aminopeptidase
MSVGSIIYKSTEEIELLRKSSLLVGKTLAEVAQHLRPGITTSELDSIAETFLRDHGALPSFKGYHGFAASLCISINEEVVHGIPGKREIAEGDIVSIDCGAYLNGFHGDSAYTFAVHVSDTEVLQLLRVTLRCLELGIEKAKGGNRVGDISASIQEYAERHGYGVVRELVGHGVGRSLHEKPDVPNYGKKGSGPLLKPGMTLAVEPMINMGTKNVKQMGDGWTVITQDKKPAAHFEHTIAITTAEADVLSSFIEIEKSIAKNQNITELTSTTVE